MNIEDAGTLHEYVYEPLTRIAVALEAIGLAMEPVETRSLELAVDRVALALRQLREHGLMIQRQEEEEA